VVPIEGKKRGFSLHQARKGVRRGGKKRRGLATSSYEERGDFLITSRERR